MTAAADLRVDLQPLLRAFGVPATVTRPAPNDTPIATRAIWVTPGFTRPFADAYPDAVAVRRLEPERVLAVPLDEVPELPRGTVIAAPERRGGPVRTWSVDSVEYADSDHRRVFVTRVPA